LISISAAAVALSAACATRVKPRDPSPRPVRALVLAETGGHHVAFTAAAKPWLDDLAHREGLTLDYVSTADDLDESTLARYALVVQLDYPPYTWPPRAMAAFTDYIETGRGGWVGLHHATLLGEFDGHPMWDWFSTFMGGIRFRSYIPTFAAGTVHVEDAAHPVMAGLPARFTIDREEWYTYDRSPRPNVRVLARVDETSYAPRSDVTMGDHPVVWTNERMAARNVYIFMGHGPDLLEHPAYTTLLRNALLWAAGREVRTP
jgi:type 1 glutamine amidotransferase